jgi:hypothetical protein
MTKQSDCEHLTICCADCGLPFLFLGPAGVAFDRPSVSVDGHELRAPIAPTWTHEAVK